MLDNLANLGIGAVFWIILTKITDPTTIGQAMIVTGLATTVIGFSGYGVQVALSKYLSEYVARNMHSVARKVLKKSIWGSLVLSGILALAISLLSGQISSLAYNNSALALLMVFTITTYLPTQTVVAAMLGGFQGMHTMKFVAISDSMFQLARMAIAVIALFSGFGVFGILLAFSLASCVELAICYLIFLP